MLNNVNFGDGTAGNVITTIIFTLVFILSPRFIMNVRELYARRLLYGSNSYKGFDSGFGIRDSQSSLSVSSVGFSHSRTPDVTEEGVEMQRVGSCTDSGYSRRSARDASTPAC